MSSGRDSEDKHSIQKDNKSIMIVKSYMLRLPSTLFSKNISIMRLCIHSVAQEMIIMDINIKWRYMYGKNHEDKQSIKGDKQSIMIFKIDRLYLP